MMHRVWFELPADKRAGFPAEIRCVPMSEAMALRWVGRPHVLRVERVKPQFETVYEPISTKP